MHFSLIFWDFRKIVISNAKKKKDIPGSGYCLCMVEILEYTGILEILCIYLQSLNGLASFNFCLFVFL